MAPPPAPVAREKVFTGKVHLESVEAPTEAPKTACGRACFAVGLPEARHTTRWIAKATCKRCIDLVFKKGLDMYYDKTPV